MVTAKRCKKPPPLEKIPGIVAALMMTTESLEEKTDDLEKAVSGLKCITPEAVKKALEWKVEAMKAEVTRQLESNRVLINNLEDVLIVYPALEGRVLRLESQMKVSDDKVTRIVAAGVPVDRAALPGSVDAPAAECDNEEESD